MDQKSNVVSINGQEIPEQDLSENQKYLIMQIRDLETQVNAIKMQLGQREVAMSTFTNLLIDSVEKPQIIEKSDGSRD
jgi:hypothetical protein|tara:strand:+ start:64 stop:297 length:234 start_codon:yes stop_codon:yes gene_type:complete